MQLKSAKLKKVFEIRFHPHTTMDFENVARPRRGIQLHVVARALPQVSLSCQQILGFEGAILRNF
jgi:hypothetical protein